MAIKQKLPDMMNGSNALDSLSKGRLVSDDIKSLGYLHSFYSNLAQGKCRGCVQKLSPKKKKKVTAALHVTDKIRLFNIP